MILLTEAPAAELGQGVGVDDGGNSYVLLEGWKIDGSSDGLDRGETGWWC